MAVLILALSLTLSTIDTLINAISSLFIVNGDQINKRLKGKKLRKNKFYYFIIMSFSFYFSIERV